MRAGGKSGEDREDQAHLHFGGVDAENLESTVLVREGDLHVDLETAGTEEGLVDHVKSVRHSDDEDVVELIDTIHLREQLIDDRVADTGSAPSRTTLLADGVELIKDDNVQARVLALSLVLCASLRLLVSP